MFGNSGREVVTQTFCSNTAEIAVIAAHLRKISGAWRFLVSFTNDSIQDSNLRLPGPLVWPGVIFEAVRVFGGVVIIKIALIPAYFAVVWDSHDATSVEFYGDREVGHDLRDDDVFVFLGVHESKGVMVVHHDGGDVLPPDVEHGLVYELSQTRLRVIGNRFPEGARIVASTKKPSFSSKKADKVSLFA